MNILKTFLLAGLLFSQSSFLASLCLGNGCQKDAQEKTSYCAEHGCPKDRSAMKVCTKPKDHSGLCTFVTIKTS